MQRYLVDMERKMKAWLSDCRTNYFDSVAGATWLNDVDKDTRKRRVSDFQSNGGVYSDQALRLDLTLWEPLRGDEEI